jgi:tetratricopeptide (TPR) repeat protein
MDLKALEQQAEQLEARVNKNAADYATLRELALVYHYMALKDSKAYAKKAVQRLDEAFRKKPDDNVVLCYLGNAYVLSAKDGGDQADRAANVNRGFEYMDKAVRRAPDDVTVRLTRGMSAKASPKFLGRRPVAYEDFEYLADLIDKGLKLPQSMKTVVYSQLADLYREDGDNARAQKYASLAEKAKRSE